MEWKNKRNKNHPKKKTERKQQPNVCTSYGRPFWASDIKIQHRKSRFVFFVFFSSLPIDFNPPTTTQKGYYGFDSTYWVLLCFYWIVRDSS